MATASKRGKRKGAKNRGYYFRKGRGWYTSDKRPLLDAKGAHVKDPATPRAELDQCHARWLLGQQDAARRGRNGNDTLVSECCRLYLESAAGTPSGEYRKRYLFDFCTGFEGRYIKGTEGAKRTHKGYGNLPVSRLIKMDITQWLDAHPGWGKGGARRTAVQAIKRAFNYCKEQELIESHPLEKYASGSSAKRVTYLDDSQEAALKSATDIYFRQAIDICIRTGARPGCEFGHLEKRHVKETERGQTWVIPKDETKMRKKDRVILVPPDIAAIVRKQMTRYPTGKLFRNKHDNPWTKKAFATAIKSAMLKARKKHGVSFEGVSVYTFRHTFAKRTLTGYWTGQLCTIEVLCQFVIGRFKGYQSWALQKIPAGEISGGR